MGIIERKIRDRQKRTKEIVDGAKDIFIAKGFNNSTMNDIANMSDLSRRTLYLYFHNKEEILLTIAVNTLEKLVKEIKEDYRPKDSGLNQLLLIANKYSNLFLTDAGSFQFVPNFTSCVYTLGIDNDIVKKCTYNVQNISNLVCEKLKIGVKDGSIRPVENINKTAAFVISIMHSCIQTIQSDNGLLKIALKIEPSDFLDEAIKVIVNYLTKGLIPISDI
jgi:AcrR family transcriptional regulator